MDRETFLKFISYFGISRPGCYDVSDFVIEDCYDETIESGDLCLDPLYCYERALYFSWELNNEYIIHSDQTIQFIESYLRGDEYYFPTEKEKEGFYWKVVEHKRNLEKQKTYEFRRKKATQYTSKPSVRKQIFKRDGAVCKSCNSKKSLTIDHIISVKNGGTDNHDNLQVLCRACNSSKGAR